VSGSTGGPGNLLDLAPAYALGALSSEEAREFERELARSTELQRAVAEYREVCALLATAGGVAPPAALKTRLMQRVRDDKAVSLEQRRAEVPSRGRGLLPRLLVGAALAAAVILAVVYRQQAGSLRLSLRERDSVLAERSSKLASREAELNAILEPGVQLVTLTTTGTESPVVQVFWDRRNNLAVLHSFRLRPAPAGRAYQLWLLPRQGSPIASTVFNTESDGHGLLTRIPIPDPSITGFALTEEPASGSPQPTSTPFLVGLAGK
jgi:anti-sigma-K factor RskA